MSGFKSVVLAAAAATGLILATAPAEAQYYAHPGYVTPGYGHHPYGVNPRAARKQAEWEARRQRKEWEWEVRRQHKEARYRERVRRKHGFDTYANPYDRGGYGHGYGGRHFEHQAPRYHYPQQRTQTYYFSW
jgi:hypothetical protein